MGDAIPACFNSNFVGLGSPSACFMLWVFPSQLDSRSWRAHCTPAPNKGRTTFSGPLPPGKQEEIKGADVSRGLRTVRGREYENPSSSFCASCALPRLRGHAHIPPAFVSPDPEKWPAEWSTMMTPSSLGCGRKGK